MKKTYLKPEVLSINVVVDSMIAQSAGGGVVSGGGTTPPGYGAKEQEGNWDNIWK